MTDCITALEYEGGIIAIDSGMVRPQMAACYLLETDSAVAIIEAGNNDSTERIIKVLKSRGIPGARCVVLSNMQSTPNVTGSRRGIYLNSSKRSLWTRTSSIIRYSRLIY